MGFESERMARATESIPSSRRRAADSGPVRFGVIDIGSNSVRLVVFDSETRTPAVFFNEKVLCALGSTLEADGRLSPTGRERAIAALRRFVALTSRMNLRSLVAVGTAALREAADGADFVEEVRREVGITVRIAAGEDEARLAAQGVLLGDPAAQGVVADMGGASMELVEISPQGAGPGGVTTPLGPLRLQGWKNGAAAKKADKIDKIIAAVIAKSMRKPPALYVLGGSWRALVNCYMEQNNYPLRVLHGFAMPYQQALAAAEWGAGLTREQVMELTGVSDSRAEVTPPAALVLSRLLRALKPERMVLSAFGLREGVLWEQLPAELRRRDPLIDACAAMEASISRMPGFGRELWDWLRPVLHPFGAGEERLAFASCLLADANWRTHPDYRSRSSFELVTRNNLGGVDHSDRLFIGAALLNRHKGGKRAMRSEPAIELLTPDRLQRAEAVGRGVRLGAMLSGATTGLLPDCPLSRIGEGAEERLVLTVGGQAKALTGEEVQKRLEAFGSALGLRTQLVAG